MWDEWFAVDNLRLMALVRASSEKTVIAARGKLIEAGLLEYRKGKKGSPGKYRMISLCSNYYSKNDSVFDSVFDSENDSTTYSHNKLKTKDINNSDDGDGGAGARDGVEKFSPELLFRHYFGREGTPAELESCRTFLRIKDPALVQSAFEQACAKDKKNMAYVRGVLRRFSERGIRTEEDEAAFDLTRRA